MLLFQLHTSVSLTSGSVIINTASRRRGSVTVRTTVPTLLMRIHHTAPAEPVDPDTLNAGTVAVSLTAGNVTWTTTAETIRTNRWTSAVSGTSVRGVSGVNKQSNISIFIYQMFHWHIGVEGLNSLINKRSRIRKDIRH